MQVQSLGQEDPLEEGTATPVFLPGESQGQRSVAGYSPWGRKDLDTAEATAHVHAWQGPGGRWVAWSRTL